MVVVVVVVVVATVVVAIVAVAVIVTVAVRIVQCSNYSPFVLTMINYYKSCFVVSWFKYVWGRG